VIVWVSDCPDAPGGFGKVTRYILHHLRRAGFKVASVCFGRTTVAEMDGYKVYPFATPAKWLLERIKRDHGEDIEAVVVHGAPWVYPFNQAVQELRAYLPGVKFFGYYVHEAFYLPSDIRAVFQTADVLITPTEFTAEVLGMPAEKVPHGVEPKIWRPLDVPKFGRFTIAMVAKNHPRKRWDLFFEVIGRLRKEGYDVQALAWTTRKGYWDIEKLVKAVEWRLGVDVPAIMPNPYDATFGVPDGELAKILAQAHVHLEMTMGEAWGLPITETMALGLPNLVVDYPAIHEWAKRKVSYIESAGRFYSVEGLIHPVPSVEDAVEKLKGIIEDYEKHAEKAKRTSRAIRREFNWSRAGRQMVKVLELHL